MRHQAFLHCLQHVHGALAVANLFGFVVRTTGWMWNGRGVPQHAPLTQTAPDEESEAD